jgi:hypothetical protein
MLSLLAVDGVGMPRKYGSYVPAGEGLEDFRRLGVWGRIVEFLNP